MYRSVLEKGDAEEEEEASGFEPSFFCSGQVVVYIKGKLVGCPSFIITLLKA